MAEGTYGRQTGLQLRSFEAGHLWPQPEQFLTRWTAFSDQVISRHIADPNQPDGRAHKFERAVNDTCGPPNRPSFN